MSGNKMEVTSNDFIFHSSVPEKNITVHCGESGLSMRMFAPIASLYNYDITFTGEGSILKRPMNFFDDVLPLLDVQVQSNSGKLPVTFRGPLQPKDITVDGSLSSQFLTGLLFAFAKACTAPVSITVNNLSSRPYIDLTISVLNDFGFRIDNLDYEVFTIHPQEPSKSHTISYTVEGDWSSASFLLVAGAIAGDIKLQGADIDSSQADKNIIQALRDCGADVTIDKKEITIKKNQLKSFDFDATHCPDLFPPLVALAAYCEGTTTIKGVNRLLFKESNRAIALRDEFKKMNVEVAINGDLMTITGSKNIKGAVVSSHHDHRIAMATAVAALGATGNTTIRDAGAINKSYPGFYEDLDSVKRLKAEG